MSDLSVSTYETGGRWRFNWVLPVLFSPRRAFAQVVEMDTAVWHTPILILTGLVHTLVAGGLKAAAAASGQITLPPGPLDLELSVNYTDDFNQPQVLTKTLTINIIDAPIFEEPIDGFPEKPFPEVVEEPETLGQKVWRFILGLLGLLGLSSGVPQPAQPDFGVPGDFPVDGPVDAPVEGPVFRL